MRKIDKIALILACFASACQGRRVQSAVSRSQGIQFADVKHGLDRPSTPAGTALKALATLLAAPERVGAFNPSVPGARAGNARLRRTSRQPSLTRRTPSHPEMFFSISGLRPKVDEKEVAKSKVEQYIAMLPTFMVSKSTCPFCDQAKNAFKSIGHDIKYLDIDNLPPGTAEAMQEHMLTLTGARTVPRVFVGHKFIGGGTDVVRLAESGELKTLVEEAQQAHMDDLQGKEIGSIEKSDEEWRKELGDAYRILRRRGTEMPHSHEYNQFYPETGYFACAGCDLPLYSASSKFKSNCGWPVFDQCYHSEDLGCHVLTRPDGTGSLEIVCPKCSGHLGHVFFDSFSDSNPNGERH